MRAYTQTFGQILKELKPDLPSDLYERLETCLKKRNFLAHHFWFERVHRMATDTGLMELRDELDQLTELFYSVNEETTDHFDVVREKIGFTPEILAASLSEVMAGADEPLPTRRLLRKQETIVAVWNAPVEGKGSTLVFETDDGELWQLCEVGLGWSRFTAAESDWVENPIVTPHLPAVLNPRPPDGKAWDYALSLRGGASLWVKKSGATDSFRWGIRTRHTDATQ